MSTVKRIYKNTSYLGIAEIISRFLQFIIMMYAARLLTKGDFGKFSFALSISFIAVILADLGLNTLFIREVARDKKAAPKYFANALALKSMLSVLTFGLMVLVLNLLEYDPITKKITYVIWFFTILSSYTELFYSVFRSFERMQYDAIVKITRMLILTAASLYVLFTGGGVLLFGYTFVATELLIVMLGLFIVATKFIPISIELDIQFAKKIMKKALPFGLAFIFGSVYFYIGTIFLSKIHGDEYAAVFSSAYNIALALLFIPTVYINAIYPVLSRYFISKKEGLRILYERSFKYLYIIGLPISIGIYLLASDILSIIYDNKYPEATIVLQIIALYLFIKFINFLLGIVLSSINQQKKRLYGQGITALCNILLNVMLIPVYGFVGAAAATLITEIFLFFVYYFFVSKSWYYFNFAKLLFKPLIAVGAMSLFVHFLQIPLLLTIIGGSLVYFGMLFILRTFDQRDFKMLKEITK